MTLQGSERTSALRAWQTPWPALNPAGAADSGVEEGGASCVYRLRLIVSWPRARGGWILRPLCTSWRRPWGLAPGRCQPGDPGCGGPTSVAIAAPGKPGRGFSSPHVHRHPHTALRVDIIILVHTRRPHPTEWSLRVYDVTISSFRPARSE